MDKELVEEAQLASRNAYATSRIAEQVRDIPTSPLAQSVVAIRQIARSDVKQMSTRKRNRQLGREDDDPITDEDEEPSGVVSREI